MFLQLSLTTLSKPTIRDSPTLHDFLSRWLLLGLLQIEEYRCLGEEVNLELIWYCSFIGPLVSVFWFPYRHESVPAPWPSLPLCAIKEALLTLSNHNRYFGRANYDRSKASVCFSCPASWKGRLVQKLLLELIESPYLGSIKILFSFHFLASWFSFFVLLWYPHYGLRVLDKL